MNRTRVRNPVDPSSLAVGFLLVGGGFYIAGRTGMLDTLGMQPLWNDLFNKGIPPKGVKTGILDKPPGQQPPARPMAEAPVQSQPPQLPPTQWQAPTPSGLALPDLPDIGVGLYLDFWADKFDYVPGAVIKFYGRLFLRGLDGKEEGIPFARVEIVDPDVNDGTAWYSAITAWDGWWEASYQANETTPWRSFGYFAGFSVPIIVPLLQVAGSVVIGKYRSGVLAFHPEGAAPTP